MFIVEGTERHEGRKVGNGHCVQLVRESGDVPPTTLWRRGKQVRGNDVAQGTVIATFDPKTKRYMNATDGSSHAAIFLQELPEGLRVRDQWVGNPVSQRTIRFRGGTGKKADDGDQYFVVEV